jgi:hypothetical protein
LKNSLSEREQTIARKAYLIGNQDVFKELGWDKVYAVVGKAVEGGPAPEQSQAADAGASPETTEGATAASE